MKYMQSTCIAQVATEAEDYFSADDLLTERTNEYLKQQSLGMETKKLYW